MKFCLRIVFLVFFLFETLAQDGFDLSDALDTYAPTTPAKPEEKPKDKPKVDGFDLSDALDTYDTKPNPDKPAVPPKQGGGGGTLSDSDLFDIGGGDYKPDGGRSGGGARAEDPGYDPHGGADQPQEAGAGQIAGIVSAIGAALVGAAGSYIAYQKKKLCFKLQGGTDPESGKGTRGTHSDPQVLSNLLRTN